ncbi:MAG: hypothetical protein LLF86_09095 [Nitrospiraceae bacterium]|nr:hypothetical protein [Nitrospiraceae bacterium]
MKLTARCTLVVIAIFCMASYAHCEEQRYSVPIEDSPFYGPANAAVTIIEFLDYQ